MYITVHKYRLKRNESEVREAVITGRVPILKASPGFQAGVSVFDTESNANAATDRTLTWVNAHIRELVVLPPDAMFSGEAHQFV